MPANIKATIDDLINIVTNFVLFGGNAILIPQLWDQNRDNYRVKSEIDNNTDQKKNLLNCCFSVNRIT